MRYLLGTLASALAMTTASFAADNVYVDPIPAPAQERFAQHDWTGFYVGVFGGLATGDFDYDAGLVGAPAELFIDVSGSGAFAGAQAGYDWQTGSWVFGAVADIALTSHSAGISASIPGVLDVSASSELQYLGTVRARAGYAFDRALLYAQGGFAYGKTEQNIDFDGTSIFSGSTTKTGWVVGAGLEYALTDAISIQTEYGYHDLGRDEVFRDDLGFGDEIAVNEDVRFHSLKAAINYRF